MKHKKKLIFLLCFSLIGNFIVGETKSSYAFEESDDEDVVEVLDYNLKRGFLEAINYFNGIHTPITDSQIRNAVFKKKDLKKITALSPEVCQAHNTNEEGVKISDLTGIEACVNLKDLSLVNQKITNLEPLKNLKKLERLELRNSSNKNENGEIIYISDVSPLKNLVNLKILNLQQAKIKNVEELSSLINMEHLNLMSTKISSLDFAKNMKNLKYLDVSYNNISDVSALENCTNLKFLNFSSTSSFLVLEDKNKVSDISSLLKLQNLEELRFSNHNVSDISVVKNFKNLTNLEFQNNLVENFESLFSLNNLKELWIRGNKKELTNDISNFKIAKDLFSKVSKEVLTKENIVDIENILNADETVKNFFSDNTIKNLEEMKKELNEKDSVKNSIFLESEDTFLGKLVSIKDLDDISIFEGENILEKLPKEVEIVFEIKKEEKNTDENKENVDTSKEEKEKDNKEEKEKEQTQEIEIDNKNLGFKGNRLYLKFVDENGKVISDDLNLVAKSDFFDINAKLEDGMYYFKSDGEECRYNLNLNSQNYELKDKISFTTAYDSKNFTGKFVEYAKNQEKVTVTEDNLENLDKNLFVISLQTKKSDETEENKENTVRFFNAVNFSLEKETELNSMVVGVNWNLENFVSKVGEYKIKGDLILPNGIENLENLKASINVFVKTLDETKELDDDVNSNKDKENVDENIKEENNKTNSNVKEKENKEKDKNNNTEINKENNKDNNKENREKLEKKLPKTAISSNFKLFYFILSFSFIMLFVLRKNKKEKLK